MQSESIPSTKEDVISCVSNHDVDLPPEDDQIRHLSGITRVFIDRVFETSSMVKQEIGRRLSQALSSKAPNAPLEDADFPALDAALVTMEKDVGEQIPEKSYGARQVWHQQIAFRRAYLEGIRQAHFPRRRIF